MCCTALLYCVVVPQGVKMLYDGVPVDLTPEQEEVATFFAVMKETGGCPAPGVRLLCLQHVGINVPVPPWMPAVLEGSGCVGCAGVAHSCTQLGMVAR